MDEWYFICKDMVGVGVDVGVEEDGYDESDDDEDGD